jgi:hypothetical protein
LQIISESKSCVFFLSQEQETGTVCTPRRRRAGRIAAVYRAMKYISQLSAMTEPTNSTKQ